MNVQDLVGKDLVTISVKGMWVKYVENDNVLEVIIPQRLNNTSLKETYFHDKEILDQRLVTQTYTIPYSILQSDGSNIETKTFNTKYHTK